MVMDSINRLIAITQEIQALENAAELLEECTSIENIDEEVDIIEIIQKKAMELENEREEILEEFE